MSGESKRDLLDFTVEVALRAGQVTLSYFQTNIEIERKDDGSPVTIADRESEQLARSLIEARFPTDGIIGEEFGTVRSDAGRRWILDPIDGTASFIHGVPLYGVLIAIEERGEAIAGVLHFPALGETVCAARGEGCWWNSQRASVSSVATIEDALVLSTEAEEIERRGHGEGWGRLRGAASMVRTWGDCYGHALVATGRAEIMLDPILAVWDAAALRPVIEEAGGAFTDWKGTATHLGGHAISTNGSLATEARALLGVGRKQSGS